MKERPILFSAPMVRALLAGTKTQTRRLCKAGKVHDDGDDYRDDDGWPLFDASRDGCGDVRIASPYGQPGDRLWVRETFAKVDGQTQPWIETDYRATYTHGDRLGDTLGIKKRWTPAIHMPRAASRINLDVTGVRVEQLQDISEADAKAEGSPLASGSYSHRGWYRELWGEINGPGSWDANPWVWVIEFRRAV
jgi:hypothetical protein